MCDAFNQYCQSETHDDDEEEREGGQVECERVCAELAQGYSLMCYVIPCATGRNQVCGLYMGD